MVGRIVAGAGAVRVAVLTAAAVVRVRLGEAHLRGGALMVGQMMMVDNGLHLFAHRVAGEVVERKTAEISERCLYGRKKNTHMT